jgi:uncharacterized glyoxalase superfamily protein PhnB
MAAALTQAKGATLMDDTTVDPAPEGVVPYLIVTDARAALAWYADALEAEVRGEPIVMPDGRIGHAELVVGGGTVFLADESPDVDVAAPDPGRGAAVSLTAHLEDVDRTAARATAAGAHLERAPVDNPYGRNAVVRDPFGHRWILSARAGADPAPVERPRQGDVGYASLWVPDVERAARFFGAVLGWAVVPGSGPEGRQVEGTTVHQGLWGGVDRPTLMPCYYVDDVDAALERIRAAGGTGGPPSVQPYGRVASCTDNLGAPFAVFTPPPGDPGPRGPVNGAGHGDLAYLTMEVPESAPARSFYGAVLGWRFQPGRSPDGWQVEDCVPMLGVGGGRRPPTMVPMFRVDDLASAVARVRGAGGTSTDPEAQPYGLTAECTDDQGTRFFLGQL